MQTTNELRLALRDADESLTPHYRDHTRQSARTLAAAYREAIEALREYHDIWPDIDHEANAGACKACAVITRYRAALEGGDDDCSDKGMV